MRRGRMGAQNSSLDSTNTSAAFAAGDGGREDAYGRQGNYWEDNDAHDSSLLAVTMSETSIVHTKYLELKDRNADSVGSVDDVQTNIARLRHSWGELDTKQRMSELRTSHHSRLVSWENEQQRECAWCKEVIENEMSKSVPGGKYCHASCLDDYLDSIAPSCAYCHKPVREHQVILANGSCVHSSCQNDLAIAGQELCTYCGAEMSEFTTAVDGCKVHANCLSAYVKNTMCLQCSQPLSTGKTHNLFQRVQFGDDGWCHVGECAVAYTRATSPECFHCRRKIIGEGSLAVAMLSSLGSWAQNLPKDAKIHTSCLADFRRSHGNKPL